MKKVIIGSMVVGLVMLLGGCSVSLEKSKKPNDTKIEIKEDKVSEEDKQEEITEAWSESMGAFIYADNWIGNLSYNLDENMTDEAFNLLKKTIDIKFGTPYEELKKEQTEGRKKLSDLGVSGVEYDDYLTTIDKIREKQEQWVTELLNMKKENIASFKETLESENPEYLELSQEAGMKLVFAIQKTGVADSGEMAQEILTKAMEEHGDPTDLQ